MRLSNYQDVRSQLQLAGLELDGELQIGTTRPVRCRVRDRGREKRGWYMLHEMPLDNGDTLVVGSYGIWEGNDNGATKVTLPRVDGRDRMTPEQVEALKARMAADKKAAAAELARQHERAALRATAGWGRCSREGGSSAYLVAKGLPPGKLYGARLSPSGSLVVPIQDAKGRIWGLQAIRPPAAQGQRRAELAKEYWPKGLAKQGHWHLIGLVPRGGVLLLCEGFATGASLHEATGLPVAIAFDAGNLLPVAKALASHYKGARILVCADDDWLQRCRECGTYTPVDDTPHCAHCGKPHGKTNAGVSSAQAAALAVGGGWVRPLFPTQRPSDRKGDTDFNDLHVLPDGGLPLVSRQIEEALHGLGWGVRARGPAPAPETEGGGDSRPRARSVMPLDDLVERFVPLDDGTGDALFDRWSRKIVNRGQAVSLLPAGMRWDDVKRHPVWIERGAYYLDQVGFDPAGDDAAVQLNTWQGWPLKPAAGSCERLLALLRYLCGKDNGDDVFWWLIRWIAYPLQHPGAKLPSAVIMHGPQGTGKSTIFQVLARIYGQYATVLNQRGLEDKFNADWVDSKLYLLAEEVVTRQEMWHIKNELKELVTGEWVRVNGKHVGAFRQRNHINIVFLSNEGQPLPLDNDDRRHLVVWTPPQLHEGYYDAVQDEIAAGGVEALYQHLMQLPMDGWLPHRRPPMTDAKRQLISVSKSSELRFVDEWIDGDLDLPVGPVLSVDLYQAYARWCDRSGERRSMRSREQFLNAVGHMVGWEKKKARVALVGQAAKSLNVVIPPEKVQQDFGTAKPADQSPPDWLGQWCSTFGDTLRKGTQGFEETRWAA